MGLTKLSAVFLSPVGPFISLQQGRATVYSFGLHHGWNVLFRFHRSRWFYVIDGQTYVGVVPAMTEVLFNQGPSSEYWSMMPSLTRFMAQQQMLVTLFYSQQLPLVIYRTSKKRESHAEVKSMLVTMVLTAMLGNVTEPLEFTLCLLRHFYI